MRSTASTRPMPTPMYRVAMPRLRKAIIAKLGWDGTSEPTTSGQWVAFAFHLALETAMRMGEILSLRRSDIDFDARHAHLDEEWR